MADFFTMLPAGGGNVSYLRNVPKPTSAADIVAAGAAVGFGLVTGLVPAP